MAVTKGHLLIDSNLSPAKEDVGILVDEKIGRSQKCALTTQRANCILGCTKRRVVNREREVIAPLLLCPGWSSLVLDLVSGNSAHDRRLQEDGL